MVLPKRLTSPTSKQIMLFSKAQASKTAGDTAFMILFAVCFCHLLNDTMQSMLPAIYPLLKEELNLSFVEIGLLTLNLQITSSVIQPLVGIYADKHHHSWQLAVGMLFTFTGIFILSMATSYAMVMLAVALMGCGSSIFHPQASQVAQVAAGKAWRRASSRWEATVDTPSDRSWQHSSSYPTDCMPCAGLPSLPWWHRVCSTTWDGGT